MLCPLFVQSLLCSPMLASGCVFLESDLNVRNCTAGNLTSGIKADSWTVWAEIIQHNNFPSIALSQSEHLGQHE